MDFRAGLGDGFDFRGIASDLTGHVGDDGETGNHPLFPGSAGFSRAIATRQKRGTDRDCQQRGAVEEKAGNEIHGDKVEDEIIRGNI